MNAMLLMSTLVLCEAPMRFQRHDIDEYRAGYQVAVADVNGNGKPDVIALSTEANRVDWYENPTFRRRPVARTDRNIDLAPMDLDGDGRVEIALASGFHFSDGNRGGQIQWLKSGANLDEPWQIHPIAVDPVVHRLRWGDLDGDGRPELIHAPIFGPGSKGPAAAKPSHLWAFRVPRDLAGGKWEPWKIDESLTVLHGLYVGDLDGDGRAELLTASYEGIHQFDWQGEGQSGKWVKTHIAPGAPPATDKPGAPRGSSEAVPVRLGKGPTVLAAIEPWHGHQVVVYIPTEKSENWTRHVLDETLREGHALLAADLDGDGQDEIVAGWRGDGGGLVMYDPLDASGTRFRREVIDQPMPVEGLVAADLNGDNRLDLVAIAGRANKLVWYEPR
ncbi:MAG: VCBS repeat-containing protein [Phycisphaerae bacterium]|nr:VCBS repeat-containing protein [Phycisphaerae bacterium]